MVVATGQVLFVVERVNIPVGGGEIVTFEGFIKHTPVPSDSIRSDKVCSRWMGSLTGL